MVRSALSISSVALSGEELQAANTKNKLPAINQRHTGSFGQNGRKGKIGKNG
jgi:hypothetical protein